MSEPPQIKDILDNGVTEPYDPALFDYDEVATGVDGLDAVGDDELAEFHERKFLLVRNVFAREQIDRACDAMHDLIFKRGKGSYSIHFEPGVKDKIDQLQGTEREYAVRKLADFNDVDPRLDALLYDPGVLATLVKLGVDDPQMFQTMALIKPPGGRDKAWHQDRAYFNVPVEDPIIGVWIALDETTPENGCMFVRPGWHDPVVHFQRRDWQICDADALSLPIKPVALPMQPGDILFFDSLLPHGTPTNYSNQRRRAAQFHYASANVRKTSLEERLAIFGEEGKDVTC